MASLKFMLHLKIYRLDLAFKIPLISENKDEAITEKNMCTFFAQFCIFFTHIYLKKAFTLIV